MFVFEIVFKSFCLDQKIIRSVQHNTINNDMKNNKFMESIIYLPYLQ